ncbi:MAG: zinc ABC transporter substrate-binding protein [Alphaproteobacteria bacterium]|nr:zinc ABC transporter substrate-binding protein [Alphaproteobacteria bacterium]
MMEIYGYLLKPFVEYGFMARALAACLVLAAGSAPLGVFLVLRRMTLMGDALSHAILPGIAVAFLIRGLALWPMTLGGLSAGLAVAFFANGVTRATKLKEDASFMAAYLMALALGVAIISMKGNAVDLMHVLFGNVLAVDNAALSMLTLIAGISLVTLALCYRALVVECFDPFFLRSVNGKGRVARQVFFALVVLNLVAAFQALGTLMALGLMVLPAIAARLWTNGIDAAIIASMGFAFLSAFAGLLVSFHFGVPSGPAIVLTAGAIYLASLFGARRPRLHGAFLLLPLLLTPLSSHAAEKLRAVASFSIIGDILHEVGDDSIAITTLVGPDGDAHVYEPTPSDVTAVAHADLVFVNGLGFEGWMERLISASASKAKVVVVSQGIAVRDGDPHAWQDLQNGMIYAGNIRDALAAADPVHAEAFKTNAAHYIKELEGLDAWAKLEIGKVPVFKRKIITTHHAFNYFAGAYGINLLAVQGLTTASEPSAETMAALVDQIHRDKITALFLENMSDPRLISQLQSEGAVIGGTLYSDALSPPDGPAATYTAMFRHNVTMMADAMKRNPG